MQVYNVKVMNLINDNIIDMCCEYNTCNNVLVKIIMQVSFMCNQSTLILIGAIGGSG